EVSLPGGKADEGDKDDGDTAKREAKEEIGLDPELVNVVTVLEPFLSKVSLLFNTSLPEQRRNKWTYRMCAETEKIGDAEVLRILLINLIVNVVMDANYLINLKCLYKHLLRVVPVIGILHDKKAFKPVLNPAEVESVFDAPLEMFLKDEKRTQEEREWMGEKYLIHFFDYDDIENKKYLIWGLTAGILIRAASIVYKRPPAFIEQNPKFKVPQVVSKGSSMT
ncbi:nudix hydrolase mitochondrial-like, partial [Trifolium pratense]